jgi:ABC-type Mn2+/Zn2+ transport system ATPase subunit
MEVNVSHEIHTDDHICWGAHRKHRHTHILEVKNLSVSYGKVSALMNIDFMITCGRALALMGPNGAGKSTLLKSIASLIKPNKGVILWNGNNLREARGEIAYLPQRNDIDWTFPITVRALVEMGRYPALGWWRTFSHHDKEIVDKAIRTLNLEDLEQRQISELSGGQQQRVFLARALAQEAHILILDEPFTGLDATASQSLGELLRLMTREGRLVIASHHDLHTAQNFFDDVLLLNREQISFGTPKEVLTPEQIAETYHISTS